MKFYVELKQAIPSSINFNRTYSALFYFQLKSKVKSIFIIL